MLKNHVGKKKVCSCQSFKYKTISNHEAEEWVCLNYEGLATIIFKVHTRENNNPATVLKPKTLFACPTFMSRGGCLH